MIMMIIMMMIVMMMMIAKLAFTKVFYGHGDGHNEDEKANSAMFCKELLTELTSIVGMTILALGHND